jgi:hypothetical protein
MMREYRNGYILERFFWEELARFESASGNLRDEYPGMIGRLDAAAELARWRTEVGAAPR